MIGSPRTNITVASSFGQDYSSYSSSTVSLEWPVNGAYGNTLVGMGYHKVRTPVFAPKLTGFQLLNNDSELHFLGDGVAQTTTISLSMPAVADNDVTQSILQSFGDPFIVPLF